jgi:hypothetical protein
MDRKLRKAEVQVHSLRFGDGELWKCGRWVKRQEEDAVLERIKFS